VAALDSGQKQYSRINVGNLNRQDVSYHQSMIRPSAASGRRSEREVEWFEQDMGGNYSGRLYRRDLS